MKGRQRSLSIALVGSAAALFPALALFGFTVDDALIAARYATHLAQGHGYRFNAGGAVTDGVTPLGWAWMLAPFAGKGPLAALSAAKAFGVAAWVISAGVLALAVDRVSARRMRFAALALLPASAPLGAWSASGMETGVIAALGALCVALPTLGQPRAGAACAGVAAALRPELLPFALAIALSVEGTPHVGPRGGEPQFATLAWRRRFGALAVAAVPFVAVALIRLAVFGRPAPLSILAKQPDATLGARYAAACFLLTGPIALFAPLAWRVLGRWPRGIIAAVGVHFLAVAAAGGDWMPLSRLVVPALPAVVLGAAYVASAADARISALRLVLALSGELFVMVRIGPVAARVGEDRLLVIEELRGALVGARVIAALDIGWLGALADRATIVDLAGVTDPGIAALPGGHTTKRIPVGLLSARDVDTLVLLLAEGEGLREPWTASRFSRGVEQYIAGFPHIDEELVPVAVSNLPRLRYVVLRRR